MIRGIQMLKLNEQNLKASLQAFDHQPDLVQHSMTQLHANSSFPKHDAYQTVRANCASWFSNPTVPEALPAFPFLGISSSWRLSGGDPGYPLSPCLKIFCWLPTCLEILEPPHHHSSRLTSIRFRHGHEEQPPETCKVWSLQEISMFHMLSMALLLPYPKGVVDFFWAHWFAFG